MSEHIQHLECRCDNFQHSIKIIVDDDNGDIYLSTRINHCYPWYKRLLLAFCYLFKFDVSDGQYDVTFIKPEDHDRLRDVLRRSEIARAAYFSRYLNSCLDSDRLSRDKSLNS